MPKRGIGLPAQPYGKALTLSHESNQLNNPNGIASSSPRLAHQRLPWVNVAKAEQPQRGCGEWPARWTDGDGRNRVAVGNYLRTVTQGSSCLATPGFGTE